MKPTCATWAALASAAGLVCAGAVLAVPGGSGGRGAAGVVYVTSQGLYYDSFVSANPLPPHGPFQQLFPADDMHPTSRTEFGPGDPGYVGGRWWVDVNGNDEMDEEDSYFLCPLLGPGREAP